MSNNAKRVLFRKGTTADHQLFTGARGEITVDITRNIAIVHDGITSGGNELVGVAATGQSIVNKDSIGIGTAVADSSLTVEGDARVSGIITSNIIDTNNLLASNLNVGILTGNNINSETLQVSGISTFQDNIVLTGVGKSIQIGPNADQLSLEYDTNGLGLIRQNSELFLLSPSTQIGNLDSSKISATFLPTGGVTLKYNNNDRLYTTDSGISVIGRVETSSLNVSGVSTSSSLNVTGTSLFQGNVDLNDNIQLRLGTGNDLQLYHESNNSYINNIVGNLYIRDNGGSIFIQPQSGENSAVFNGNTSVDLYYNGVKKFETTLTGIAVTEHAEIGTINVSGVSTFQGNVSIGTDTNLTAKLTVGNIENTVVTNKGATAFKTLASDGGVGESAIYLEEQSGIEGWYLKVNSSGDLQFNDSGVSDRITFQDGGNIGIGTDSNLTANLTIGNIENTSVTNKGALAIKTLSNSDSDIGASAIYIEEPDFGYGFYHKVTSYYGGTHHQIQESGSGNILLTISDSGDVGIKTNYADTFALKILAEDENVIKIENNNNGLFGSEIRVVQDSSSPVANDKLLTLDIRGNDSGGNETTYAEIISSIEDPTNGSEDGKLTIQTRTAGTLTDRIVIDSGGVGIGTTNPTNAALHVAGRNLSLGGPGYNSSGESNLYLGDYNAPANNTYDPNIRVGTRDEFQFEIESDYGNGTRSNNTFYASPLGLGLNIYGDSSSPGQIFYYNYSRTAADQYLYFSANSKYLWFDGDTGRLGINRSSGSGWTDTLDVNGNAKINGSLTATGDITAFSDITLKKNIELIPNALDKVLSLRGVTYNRIDIENEPKQSGVIAQELEEVLPEVVSTNEEGIKSVAYGNMVGLLIEAIKDLKEEVETLKDEIKNLKNV